MQGFLPLLANEERAGVRSLILLQFYLQTLTLTLSPALDGERIIQFI